MTLIPSAQAQTQPPDETEEEQVSRKVLCPNMWRYHTGQTRYPRLEIEAGDVIWVREFYKLVIRCRNAARQYLADNNISLHIKSRYQ